MEVSFIYAWRRKMKYLLLASRLSLALSSHVWRECANLRLPYIAYISRVFYINALNYNKSHYNSIRLQIVVVMLASTYVTVHYIRDLTPHWCLQYIPLLSKTPVTWNSIFFNLLSRVPSLNFIYFLRFSLALYL